MKWLSEANKKGMINGEIYRNYIFNQIASEQRGSDNLKKLAGDVFASLSLQLSQLKTTIQGVFKRNDAGMNAEGEMSSLAD